MPLLASTVVRAGGGPRFLSALLHSGSCSSSPSKLSSEALFISSPLLGISSGPQSRLPQFFIPPEGPSVYNLQLGGPLRNASSSELLLLSLRCIDAQLGPPFPSICCSSRGPLPLSAVGRSVAVTEEQQQLDPPETAAAAAVVAAADVSGVGAARGIEEAPRGPHEAHRTPMLLRWRPRKSYKRSTMKCVSTKSRRRWAASRR